MKLKVIESIIDSIDVFNVVKDMGLKIINKPIDISKSITNATYESTIINNSELKLINSSFLNLELYKSTIPDYVAGSGIDLLAYFYHGDYDKAFNAYFKLYGNALKSKLIHEPSFIKGILKNTFIKRHNLLQHTVRLLFSNSFSQNIESKTWLSKHNIEEDNVKGFMFSLSAKDLKKYLVFIFNQEFLNIADVSDEIANDFNLKKILPELDLENPYFKSYIITPYFSNYYSISFLKITNPITNEVCYAYLDDMHIAYAGLYSLSKFTDFNSKIRLLEDSIKTAALTSNAKKMLHLEKQYLAIGINNNGINSPTLCLSKPIFLYEPNSSLYLLKTLNIVLPNFYICEFNNMSESYVVYKWEDFIFKVFKKLVETDKYLSPKVKAFFDIIDFSSFKIKRYIANWLKENKYEDIYKEFNTISTQVIHFKNYSISATSNGYMVLLKNTNETIVLSNFIIKLNNCIVFKDKDDMKVNGVLIMGENNEYPLTFYKKDLAKKDALENIALKAFSSFNILDGIFNETITTNIQNKLPVIIDKSYNSALTSIINNELSMIPCCYGAENKGWDKVNKIFTTPVWRANSTGLKILPQYFYINTEADYCFKNTLVKSIEYKKNLTFLNREVKDIISILLAYLYRTYFSYPIKPAVVTDSKNSRNLLRFIFAAFGQREVFEYDVNNRLIKNKKIFNNLNQFPLLVRSNNPDQLYKVQNYPYILLTNTSKEIKQTYDINLGLNAADYPKITKFTLNTFERFFNWLFSLKVEEYEISDINIENQDQLIKEGNKIFDLLWWKDVIKACDKKADTCMLFRKLISSLKKKELLSGLNFLPDENCYGFGRKWYTLQDLKIKKLIRDITRIGLKENFFYDCNDLKPPYYINYIKINKEFLETVLSMENPKDSDEKINPKEIQVFFQDNVESEMIEQKYSPMCDTNYTKYKQKNLVIKKEV